MKSNAECVELKIRIATLRNYETLYSFFNVTYANIFPKVTTIMLTHNKDILIKYKQRFLLSENATIVDIQKGGKVSQNFDYLYGDWTYCGKPLRLNEKLLKKIVAYVKTQQENQDLEDKDID